MLRKVGRAEVTLPIGDPMPIQNLAERLIAVGYGVTYDAVVRGFRPYDALLDEIAALVGRSRPSPGAPLRVLDVSCGIGTVAGRLGRDGHAVVGLDAVGYLVAVARAKARSEPRLDVVFHHVDVARGPVPGRGTYDVVVSMHTLYWHPDPGAVLEGCRRALKPGGHAVFLTYARPADVGRLFGEIRTAQGVVAAVRALRWLVPTALFETFRDCEPRYWNEADFHGSLARAGFEVLEARQTFLAGISRLAWARTPAATVAPVGPSTAP
jgi:SAM-dependent methyltransferase